MQPSIYIRQGNLFLEIQTCKLDMTLCNNFLYVFDLTIINGRWRSCEVGEKSG
jgi:hypothetical protein